MDKTIIHRRNKYIRSKLLSKNQLQRKSKSKPVTWQIILLALITAIVFAPALKNDFTNWDDSAYVKNNPLLKDLSLTTVKEMFLSKDLKLRYWMGNYHPLTMLSLNISYHLANDNGKPVAWIFILSNIILHLINTLLVYLLILRLTNRNFLAFATALIFAVHTIHVESVVWISERKDVLYTLFYLWAAIQYLKFIDSNNWSNYIFALVLFVLSLLAKGQAVSLAPTLILFDLFRRRNLRKWSVWLEKIPFFALALIFGLIAIQAQKYSLALLETSTYELYKRIGIAAYGFVMYLLKLVLPLHLSALYPYPDIIHKAIPWYYYVMLVPALGTLILLWYWIKKRLYIPALGLAFFIVNIALLLQLIPVGSAIYADRYAYIPSIGIFLVFSFFLHKIPKTQFAYTVLFIYIAILSMLTVKRISVWHDSLSLWKDTVQKSPKAVVAWNNLGTALSDKAKQAKENGQLQLAQQLFDQAADAFQKAINGKPDYTNAFYNLSTAQYELFLLTRDSSLLHKALHNVNKAIASKVDFTDAFLQRGIIYDHIGQIDKAALDYKRVLELDPKNPRALANLGTYYGKKGKLDTAISLFKKALKLDPELQATYSNLGLAFMEKGQLDSAIIYLQKALEKKQEPIALYNLAIAYRRKGNLNKAIDYLSQALKLAPNDPEFLYTMGNFYIEAKQAQKACEFYQKAAQMKYNLAIKALKIFCKK